jgi:phosphonate C-P lyase system protein PhnG
MADEIREAFPDLTDDEAQDILALLKKQDGIGFGESQQGMVMLTAKDPFGYDFYVGEVFVTEAEAIYNSGRGYGMVMGDKPRQAMVLAVYDALTCEGALSGTGAVAPDGILEIIRGRMKDAVMRRTCEKEEQNRMAASTKVNFGLMSEG